MKCLYRNPSAGGFDTNTKNVAAIVAVIVIVVAVAGVAYWAMNDNGDDADATYTISMSYDSETGNATGAGSYTKGDTVTVTASPADGYGFKGWFIGTEMVSGDSTYSFEAVSDVVLTPSFRVMYNVSVDWNPNYGTVVGAGQYMEGDTCTLVATPKSDCSLAAWMDDKDYPMFFDSTWSFTVVGDRYYYADMGENGVEVTILYNSDQGSVTPSSIGSVDYGTQIEFSAYANMADGYHFDHWVINGVTSDDDYDFREIVTEDLTVEAIFELNNYQISLVYDDSMGRVSGVNDGSYVHGTVLHLQATPMSGYIFDHWEIDGNIYTNQELSFTITKGVTIRAIFVME